MTPSSTKSKERRKTKARALQGFITNYRTGPRTQHPKECILKFPNIKSSGEAAHLIGRKVGWPIAESKVRGKITALHGKSGLVRARFRKGVPGEALGALVEIIG